MADPLIPSKRAEFSAIVDRPPLKLPNNARVIFWTIVNYEVWDISRPMARQVIPAPTGQVLLPDVPNWSWHEYGMRVGCWRFFELYARLDIKPTLAINARVCEDYPRVAEQAKRDGWEFMGHSYQQGAIHNEPDQKATASSSCGSNTSSLATLPRMRSRSGSMMSSPSLSAAISSPRIVPQSSSVTITSCATSTRRRVR